MNGTNTLPGQQFDELIIHMCYRHGMYFPMVGIVLILVAFVVLILLSFRLFYTSYNRPYAYYLIATCIYFVSVVLRNVIQWNSPVQDCFYSSNNTVFSISPYGFPDPGLSLFASVVISNVIMFGTDRNRFFIISSWAILCLISFAYYYSQVLSYLQVMCTLAWGIAITILSALLIKIAIGFMGCEDPDTIYEEV